MKVRNEVWTNLLIGLLAGCLTATTSLAIEDTGAIGFWNPIAKIIP
ncbi:MAG: hypothetical protein ACEY3J_03395 [Arsenophonus sp.]